MHRFYLASLLGLSAVSSSAALNFSSLQARDVQNCCNELKQSLPNNTYFESDVTYINIDEDFFSASSWLGPACIVSPVTAKEMSSAIKTFADSQTPFAIRGGGHMPIPDAANIDSRGVLLTSFGFDQLKLSEDKSTIEVGAGNKWGQVYEYLEPYKLTVVGGRAGLVGVPGFLLGGGISFFGNEYGWASANVVQYDCVLANGDVVSATADNKFSDLFWALRGGGNSFAILTAVHLKTFSLPAVAVGETTYNGTVTDDFLDSIYDFSVYGSEYVKAGIEPGVQWIPQLGNPTYHGILFYNGDDASPPELVNFTDKGSMQPVSSTFMVRNSMYNWTQEADSDRGLLHGLRARFNLVTIKANRQALKIIHDTFLEMMADELEGVTNIIGSLAFVPITKEYLKVSTINGGDPMAVDASQAPYILVEESFLWSSPGDDGKISSFLDAFNVNITSQLDSLDGVLSPFLYLNYADESQAVFKGYPKENVARMKDIREKYDPDMVFTDLMPGGWKVEKA